MSFAKKIGKNISKNLGSKYSQKLLNHTKKSATDALTTASKRAIQKTAEATDDLVGNRTADKITKSSINSPQNTSKTVESETEIPKKKIYLQKKNGNLFMI